MACRPLPLMSIALCVAACTINPRIHIFNDSQQSMTFTFDSFGHQVASAPGAQVSFQFSNRPVVATTSGGCILTFTFSTFPRGYGRPSFRGQRFYFQIEPDGNLYAVEPEEKRPIVVGQASQPDGFPLVPLLSGDCSELKPRRVGR